MITIVHGGQTGVDSGAHDGAVANGWAIAGFMPHDKMGEDGPIPANIRVFLQACRHKGYAARTKANLEIAHALLVIVQDTLHPHNTPGTKLTLAEARRLALPRLVVDPTSHIGTIADWLTKLLYAAARDPFKLMVAGPRLSKWPDGRVATATLLHHLKHRLQGPT